MLLAGSDLLVVQIQLGFVGALDRAHVSATCSACHHCEAVVSVTPTGLARSLSFTLLGCHKTTHNAMKMTYGEYPCMAKRLWP